MAKRRPPQTVAPLQDDDLPRGAVGASLASNRADGVLTRESQDELDEQTQQSNAEKVNAFIAMARKRWRQSAQYESELRKEMLDDLRFYNAEQWPDNIKMDRVLDGRPCLTINRLPQFVRQVLNQARQQPPLKLTTYRDMIKESDTKPGPDGEPPKVQIIRSRPTVRRQLKWATINGIAVLDGNADKTAGRNLPGPYIPLVPIEGEKLVVNGKRNIRGMIRDAKDPQRTYNFWVSAETEMIALAPRAP